MTSASTAPDGALPSPARLRPFRGIVAAGVDLLLPRPCPGCGGPEPWCARCAAVLDGPPRRIRWPTVVETDGDDPCRQAARAVGPGPPQVWALARYEDPARAAILAGKERGRRDLPVRLGHALGQAITHLVQVQALPTPLWLVPAPSRRSSARRRGGDPVTVMARHGAAVAATAVGRPLGVAPCLFTDWRAADSVGLDARDRAANLRRRVRWSAGSAPPHGAAVLVVDDVFTSGATIATAAEVLHRHRRAVHGALVLAAAGSFDGLTGPSSRRAVRTQDGAGSRDSGEPSRPPGRER